LYPIFGLPSRLAAPANAIEDTSAPIVLGLPTEFLGLS
jgi:hypothetical protein